MQTIIGRPNNLYSYILYVAICQLQEAWKSLQILIHFLVQKLKGCNEKKKNVSKI